MVIYTTHTTSTAKDERASSLRQLHIVIANAVKQSIIHETDCFVVRRGRLPGNGAFIYFQNTLLTKDILCGITAKVLLGRQELYNSKFKPKQL